MISKIEYLLSKVIKKLRLRAIVNSDIDRRSKVSSGSQLVNIKIGKYSDIGYDCTLLNVEIGAFCSFASNIVIGGASHTIDWVSTQPVFNENKDHLLKKFSYHKFDHSTYSKVGNDVWIGNNVLGKVGVQIGDGAVIGMGSVVTKNVCDFEIWAGNPAKLLRKRFDEDTSLFLKTIKWWDWDDSLIEKYAPLFNDLPNFVKKYKLDSTDE